MSTGAVPQFSVHKRQRRWLSFREYPLQISATEQNILYPAISTAAKIHYVVIRVSEPCCIEVGGKQDSQDTGVRLPDRTEFNSQGNDPITQVNAETELAGVVLMLHVCIRQERPSDSERDTDRPT
jgi:hypothetical protein